MKRIILMLGAAMIVANAAGAADELVVLPLMKGEVAPEAQRLWDVGNRGIDDNGNPDGSKLSAADWGTLADAAGNMGKAASALASAEKIAVVGPGDKLQDDGAPGSSSAQEIQAYIAANRAAFTDHARKLAAISADFADAAKTRDARKLADASGRLDEVCESCHLQFWYPKQAH